MNIVKAFSGFTVFLWVVLNSTAYANIYDVQITVNYKTENPVATQRDISLLMLGTTSNTTARWNPLPVNLPENSVMQAALNAGAPGSFSGAVIYGVADHCTGLNCDPDYTFRIYANGSAKNISGHDDCTVDKRELGADSPWNYSINYSSYISGTSVICTVNVTATPNTNPVQSINVKVMNSSDASGGTLANGMVTLNNKTTCVADDTSGDCNKAISLPVAPAQLSPVFTFTADSADRILSGKLFYPILDEALPELPVHYVAVYLQNGEQVTERCIAEITPPTEGPVHYQAQAYQIGTDEENTCLVDVTRHISN